MDSKPGTELPTKHTIYDDDRPENIRSTIAWIALTLGLGYVAINAVTPNNDTNIAIDVLLGVMGMTAAGCYVGWSIGAIWRGSSEHIDYLIVAICGSWFLQSLQALLRIISRLAHFDPAFVNSEIFGLLKLGSVVMAVLHILPRGAANGVVPRGNTAMVALALAVAAILALAVLTIRPNPMPLIEHMPWWSKDLFHRGQGMR